MNIYRFESVAKGGDWFLVSLKNILLTILTLSLYYPWARVSKLKFFYGNTTLDGSNFEFHGSGAELFKGYIKFLAGYLGLILILVLITLSLATTNPGLMVVVFYLVFYGGLLLFLPFAIYGSYAYRVTRTSWRGIRFQMVRDRSTFIKNCYRDLFLTVITCGVYSPFFLVNMYKHLFGHTSFGNLKVQFKGRGDDLLFLYVKGIFLTIITLGLYMFWYTRDVIRFQINHMVFELDGKTSKAHTDIAAGDIFMISVVLPIITILTLGLAWPWAEVQIWSTMVNNLSIKGDIDISDVIATPDQQAFGSDAAADALDIDLGLV